MSGKGEGALHRSLRPTLLLSRALGVSYFGTSHPAARGFTAVYRIVVFALLTAMLVHEVPTMKFWVSQHKSIHAMLAFAETSSRWLILLLNTLLTVLRNRGIEATLREIGQTPLCVTGPGAARRVRHMQYLHIGLNTVLILTYMSLGHFFLWTNTNYKWYTFLIYVVTEFYIGFSNVQFVQILNVVREHFKVLNSGLSRSLDGKQDGKLFTINAEHCHELFDIVKYREIHLNLCSVSGRLNQCYSVQMLLFITLCMVEITYSLRSFMLYIVSSHQADASSIWTQRPWLEFALTAFWGGYFFTSLLELVSCCDFTAAESRKSSLIVHQLINRSKDKEVVRQLQLFSLQLMNHTAVFSAARFFTLDFALIQTIVGAITTYLVIIITFKE